MPREIDFKLNTKTGDTVTITPSETKGNVYLTIAADDFRQSTSVDLNAEEMMTLMRGLSTAAAKLRVAAASPLAKNEDPS